MNTIATDTRDTHDVYLVRGIHRHRAIRVVKERFHIKFYEYGYGEMTMIIDAAKEAARRGWKTVYIKPDEIYGEYAYLWNEGMITKEFNCWRKQSGDVQGIFLGYVGPSKYN